MCIVVDIYNTDKKYNIIYVDSYLNNKAWHKESRSTNKHYKTMNLEDIVNMKDRDK